MHTWNYMEVNQVISLYMEEYKWFNKMLGSPLRSYSFTIYTLLCII